MLITRHNCNHCMETHKLEWDCTEEQEIQCSCGAIIRVELSITEFHIEPETEQEKYESYKFDSRSR